MELACSRCPKLNPGVPRSCKDPRDVEAPQPHAFCFEDRTRDSRLNLRILGPTLQTLFAFRGLRHGKDCLMHRSQWIEITILGFRAVQGFKIVGSGVEV